MRAVLGVVVAGAVLLAGCAARGGSGGEERPAGAAAGPAAGAPDAAGGAAGVPTTTPPAPAQGSAPPGGPAAGGAEPGAAPGRAPAVPDAAPAPAAPGAPVPGPAEPAPAVPAPAPAAPAAPPAPPAPAPGAPPAVAYRVALTGAAVPRGAGDPDGSGTLDLTVDPAGSVCFRFSLQQVDATTTATLRLARLGVALFELPLSGVTTGQTCLAADPAAVRSALSADPSQYVVDVATTAFPQGALRGPLTRR